MDEPRLLAADSFVVTRPPGVIGRSLLRLARRPDVDPRFWVRDDRGEVLGEVVPVTKRLRKALDGYTRHDVVGASQEKLLALRQLPRTMFVQDGAGAALGCVHHDRRVGPTFHSGAGSMAGRGPVIGHLSPLLFGRYELVFGAMQVSDPAGAVVATVTNTDGQHNIVEMSAAIDAQLRLLTVAFACSLVHPVWVHPPMQSR
jgi:hypothetical protein